MNAIPIDGVPVTVGPRVVFFRCRCGVVVEWHEKGQRARLLVFGDEGEPTRCSAWVGVPGSEPRCPLCLAGPGGADNGIYEVSCVGSAGRPWGLTR